MFYGIIKVVISMNYNEEIAELFDELGIEYKLVKINDKPTVEDYNKLKRKIFVKTEANNNMMFLSGIKSKDSMPCTNTKRLIKNK